MTGVVEGAGWLWWIAVVALIVIGSGALFVWLALKGEADADGLGGP